MFVFQCVFEFVSVLLSCVVRVCVFAVYVTMCIVFLLYRCVFVFVMCVLEL